MVTERVVKVFERMARRQAGMRRETARVKDADMMKLQSANGRCRKRKREGGERVQAGEIAVD